MQPLPADAPASRPSLTEAARVWLRIGLLSFGGPAGQIALMHRELVDKRRWIGEGPYLAGLNFCMLLPGPEAMQLATYVGWRLHGVRGGLTAGLLFITPGALVILALSLLYERYGQLALTKAMFVGIKAAVLAIVLEALIRIGRRALKGCLDLAIAGAAFLAIFVFQAPFPMIVAGAALVGVLRARTGGLSPATGAGADPLASAGTPDHPGLERLWDGARTALLWIAIWLVPLAGVVVLFPDQPVLGQIAWFFAKMAVVTFGGAYAVLAYVAQDGVAVYHWLAPDEMVDGLGLAETTPGPLILVNAFVGTLAGARGFGADHALVGGMLGWLVTLWATFAPCFLWIFVFGPSIARLNAEPRLKAALQAVTAGVVGVILNLTVWFALHVLFTRVAELRAGPIHTVMPDPASLDPVALGLAILAMAMLFPLKRGMLETLAVCAGLAALLVR